MALVDDIGSLVDKKIEVVQNEFKSIQVDMKRALEEQANVASSFQNVVNQSVEETKKFNEAAGETKASIDKHNARLDQIEIEVKKLVTTTKSKNEGEKKDEMKSLWMRWCQKGWKGMSAQNLVQLQKHMVDNLDEQNAVKSFFRENFGTSNYDELMALEKKDMIMQSDPSAGYLAVPPEVIHEILKNIVLVSDIRSICSVKTTISSSVKVPTRDARFAAQWATEAGSRPETPGLTYGMRKYPVHEMYAEFDISNSSLEDSAFDLEKELMDEFSLAFALLEGQGAVSGTNVLMPEGLLTNPDVPTVKTGSTTAITAAGLITAYFTLKEAYARNAMWIMKRLTMGLVRQIQDGSGRYLWAPALAGGYAATTASVLIGNAPGTLLGLPYKEVNDLPVAASGTYPIMLGDFAQGYLMVDRIAMETMRDPYTQAAKNNVRFLARRRMGGGVRLPEALIKIQQTT